MDPWTLPASSDDYVADLHRRLGLELAARRAALGLSAYALGKIAGVTDQTILNLERGLAKNGCCTATLARLCHYFHVSVAEFVLAAERRCLVLCPLILTLT